MSDSRTSVPQGHATKDGTAALVADGRPDIYCPQSVITPPGGTEQPSIRGSSTTSSNMSREAAPNSSCSGLESTETGDCSRPSSSSSSLLSSLLPSPLPSAPLLSAKRQNAQKRADNTAKSAGKEAADSASAVPADKEHARQLRAMCHENTKLSADLAAAETAITSLKDTITLLEASLHMANMAGGTKHHAAGMSRADEEGRPGTDGVAQSDGLRIEQPSPAVSGSFSSRATSTTSTTSTNVTDRAYYSNALMTMDGSGAHGAAEAYSDEEAGTGSPSDEEDVEIDSEDLDGAEGPPEDGAGAATGKRDRAGTSIHRSGKLKKGKAKAVVPTISSNYTSHYRGVYLRGGRWNAQIQYGGKKLYLGSFATDLDAARAYDRAAAEFHGSKAMTNFDATGKDIAHNMTNRAGVRDHATSEMENAASALVAELPKASEAEGRQGVLQPPVQYSVANMQDFQQSPPMMRGLPAHLFSRGYDPGMHMPYGPMFFPYGYPQQMRPSSPPHTDSDGHAAKRPRLDAIGAKQPGPDMAQLPSAIDARLPQDHGYYMYPPNMPYPFRPPPSHNASDSAAMSASYHPAHPASAVHGAIMGGLDGAHGSGGQVPRIPPPTREVDGHDGEATPRGKLSTLERTRVNQFLDMIRSKRVLVARGELAKELREFVNPSRSQEFYEKLISRRHLNKELAAFLVIKNPALRKVKEAEGVPMPENPRIPQFGAGLSPFAFQSEMFQPINTGSFDTSEQRSRKMGEEGVYNSCVRPQSFALAHGHFHPMLMGDHSLGMPGHGSRSESVGSELTFPFVDSRRNDHARAPTFPDPQIAHAGHGTSLTSFMDSALAGGSFYPPHSSAFNDSSNQTNFND